ncbi:hypothetical protein SmJEL517_g00975 [Synchytrium microbalum]|uniref:cAMP-independent regulatory protein pac2 n=1 Tax=Synchytrium microbalum TaxID=1806994 RepID=A0A507CG26_9FUNG|nr:uncharacterized protein SmJEL517_g00975 [Synchytrium microbalum]TPX36946.1 hypothetical protein SmJEL517_g00975 [Synchytrium microbalum]
MHSTQTSNVIGGVGEDGAKPAHNSSVSLPHISHIWQDLYQLPNPQHPHRSYYNHQQDHFQPYPTPQREPYGTTVQHYEAYHNRSLIQQHREPYHNNNLTQGPYHSNNLTQGPYSAPDNQRQHNGMRYPLRDERYVAPFDIVAPIKLEAPQSMNTPTPSLAKESPVPSPSRSVSPKNKSVNNRRCVPSAEDQPFQRISVTDLLLPAIRLGFAPPGSPETARCLIKAPQDAILVLEACRLGILPRVTKRLAKRQRIYVVPGSVFVWTEEPTGIRRWTEGKHWAPSRVYGHFLVYRQLEESRTKPSSSSNLSVLDGGLIKQTISVADRHGNRHHIVSYYTNDLESTSLPSPSSVPELASIKVDMDLYPDWKDKIAQTAAYDGDSDVGSSSTTS